MLTGWPFEPPQPLAIESATLRSPDARPHSPPLKLGGAQNTRPRKDPVLSAPLYLLAQHLRKEHVPRGQEAQQSQAWQQQQQQQLGPRLRGTIHSHGTCLRVATGAVGSVTQLREQEQE